jgi:hypothetical protein
MKNRGIIKAVGKWYDFYLLREIYQGELFEFIKVHSFPCIKGP